MTQKLGGFLIGEYHDRAALHGTNPTQHKHNIFGPQSFISTTAKFWKHRSVNRGTMSVSRAIELDSDASLRMMM
jgi:hypothetical protein